MKIAYGFSEAAASNMLVAQKNAIIHLINIGELESAAAALNVVRALWVTMDYGYKSVEIDNRITMARRTAGAMEFAPLS